jgi:hypothetical protein
VGELNVVAGSGVAQVSRAFFDSARFQRMIVEGMALTVIMRRDRYPVHAAALRRADVALLLHGPSGIGKSTLAYVAHRAGIDVLSDDSTRIQLTPTLRVWGDGTLPRVHLLAEARRSFPELRRHEPGWMSGNGVPKLVVETAPTDGGTFRPYATRVRVCLLARDATAREVTRRIASPDEIRRALLDAPEAAHDLSPGSRPRVAAALSAGGGWRLELSDDVYAALPHLQAMLDEASFIPI